MSRLEPLPRSELGALEDAFQSFKDRMGFVANSGLIMARRPEILTALAGLARAVMKTDAVDTGLKSCIGQIASWATGCRYCQAHFANNATRGGVADEKIEALWNFEKSALFSEAERAALRFAVAAAQVPNAVTDRDFDELRGHWDEGQIVEILATVCYTGFLNRWNDTLATTLEEIPTAAGQARLQASGWKPGKHA